MKAGRPRPQVQAEGRTDLHPSGKSPLCAKIVRFRSETAELFLLDTYDCYFP